MRRVFRCVGLALALVILPAVLAEDKKADADKNVPADKDKKADDKAADKDKKPGEDKAVHKDKKEAVEKLVIGGEIAGKLVHWEGAQKYFTVQVDVAVPDPNGLRRLAELQLQLAKARNAQEIINARNAMAGVKTVMNKQENVEFQAGADMKIRVLHPMVYDDKGKPKRLTRKELDELKGPDKKLPGYTGDVADIRQDSIVKVYLPKAKHPKPAPGAKDDKGLADTKPEAIMLLVVSDAPPPK